MGLTVRKLLEVYFEKWQLQNVLESIDEPVSGNTDDLVNLILQEWEPHRKNKYDLFDFLERTTLSRICKAYGLDYHGNKGDLIKRIKRSRLLDADFINIPTNESHHSEKRNDASKNLLTRKKIIAIITGVLITIAGIGGGAYYFTIYINQQNTGDIIVTNSDNVQIFTNIGNWQINQIPINENNLEDGEHGNSYIDKKAGFVIEKPSANWYFMKVEDYVIKNDLDVDENYLGGIFVATDKPGNVMVVVQELINPDKFDLSKYIDEQLSSGAIEILGKQGTLVKKFVSPNGNWASAEAYVDLTAREYARQILHKYNDRLYLIQTTGDPPEIMTDEIKNELKQIIESFRIIV